MGGSSVAPKAKYANVSLQMTPVASKLALIRFPRIPRELFRGWGDLDEGCDGLRVAVEGADGLNRIIFIEEDSKAWWKPDQQTNRDTAGSETIKNQRIRPVTTDNSVD